MSVFISLRKKHAKTRKFNEFCKCVCFLLTIVYFIDLLCNLWLCDFPSSAKAMFNLPVVTEIDESLQTMKKVVIVVIEFMIVDDESIKLVALFETANFSE